MARTTRRDFLRTSALVGTGLALTDPVGLGRTALGQAPSPPPPLTIARWDAAKLAGADLAAVATKLTEAAVAGLGGMERFVSRGDVVWIKPNIGWNRPPELAATTNPDVVAALIRMCHAAGAKTIKVGDNTCHPARQSYLTSGIAAAAEASDAQVVYLDEKRYRDVALKGERLEAWPVYTEILEADLVINVPILKHHGLTRATACMKNYMGIIGGRRNAWHQNMDDCLCDITAFMQPRISVLDAVRTLTDHGPQGGNPEDVKVMGTVAAGTDPVALDALGVEMLGHDPSRISTVRAGQERGLGTLDYRSLNPRELDLS